MRNNDIKQSNRFFIGSFVFDGIGYVLAIYEFWKEKWNDYIVTDRANNLHLEFRLYKNADNALIWNSDLGLEQTPLNMQIADALKSFLLSNKMVIA